METCLIFICKRSNTPIVISNIMIKAAASPFLSLAHSSGKADGNIDMVQIDPLQPEFTSLQYEKFAQILDVINAETGFAFSLSQQFNLQQAMNARAVFMLKRDFYKESHTLSEHLMLSQLRCAKGHLSQIVGFR